MTEENENNRYPQETHGPTTQATADFEGEGPTSQLEGTSDSSCAKQRGAEDHSHSAQHARGRRSFFSSTLSALTVIALFTIGVVGASAYFVIHKISQQGENVVVRVLVHDEIIEIKERQLGEFNATVERAVLEEHEEAYADIEAEVNTRIDNLFEKSQANVNDFVDWYYSMSGSILRLGAWTHDEDEDYVREQFSDQILGGEKFDKKLLNVHLSAQEYLQDLEADVASSVHEALLAQFDARSTDPVDGAADKVIEVNVSEAVRQAVRFSYDEDQARWQITAIAGIAPPAAAATVASGRWVASHAIASSPRISGALAKTGKQIASQIGRRAGTAALKGGTAAAATSWSGPVTAVVGTGVTISTFLGTEYAALQVARRTEGREMERTLHKSLEEVRDQLKREITDEYRQEVDRRVARVEKKLHDQATYVEDKGEFYVLGARTD